MPESAGTRAATMLAVALLSACGAEPSDDERYCALAGRFERSGDLAWAYRLAWLSAMDGDAERAADWLAALRAGGWQMGVDPDAIDGASMSGAGRELVAELQAALPRSGSTSPRVATIADAGLIPESIAWDSRSGTLYAGSLRRSRVIARDAGGAIRIVGDNVLGPVYGIKFDAATDELWVLHNPRDAGDQYGEIAIFGPDGTALRRMVPAQATPRELNDLCLDDFHVYVTDSRNDRILSAPRAGSILGPFADGAPLAYANGIACNADNPDLFVATATGLHRFDKADPASGEPLAVPQGMSLGGVDGLYLWRNRLVGVQNALGAPKIVIATLADRSSIADIAFRDVLAPDFRIPTTGFIDADCFYYLANTSLDALGEFEEIDPAARPPDPAQVLGLSLGAADSCRPRL